jgi:hypothetical protein
MFAEQFSVRTGELVPPRRYAFVSSSYLREVSVGTGFITYPRTTTFGKQFNWKFPAAY